MEKQWSEQSNKQLQPQQMPKECKNAGAPANSSPGTGRGVPGCRSGKGCPRALPMLVPMWVPLRGRECLTAWLPMPREPWVLQPPAILFGKACEIPIAWQLTRCPHFEFPRLSFHRHSTRTQPSLLFVTQSLPDRSHRPVQKAPFRPRSSRCLTGLDSWEAFDPR